MDKLAQGISRLIPGRPVPELEVPLVTGQPWRLSEQQIEKYLLIHVFRGWHCSFCQPEIEKLAQLQAGFSEFGVSILSVSMDSRERAERTSNEWQLGNLTLGYDLSMSQAREWGLYLSEKVKDKEPKVFAEPGCYLVDSKLLLYAEFQSTVPWLRMDLEILYRGIQVAMQRGTPPRGTL